MSYYFECETRNIGNGATRACDYEVVETVDMDIFLEFLCDYHQEKWEKNAWRAVSQCEWVKLPLGNLKWRRERVRAYKRYVENAFQQCFFSGKNYNISQKRPMYKAYEYFIKAYYNN